jgi:hypothetical protein
VILVNAYPQACRNNHNGLNIGVLRSLKEVNGSLKEVNGLR